MDLSKIVKDRKLILDRLPLLESGGQYAAQWHIGLKQELYNKEAEGIAALQISALKDDEAEGRPKTFAEMKALREEGKFEEVKIGDEFGESWDCWWFYVQFEVKQSWIDAQHEIHFFWDSDSEALLYTEEGKVMQGFLGEDAELSERRRAYYILKREGFKDDLVLGKVNYYIQMSCMRFKGCWNDDRTNFHSGVNMHLTFKLKQCELKAFNREVWDMLWDYYIVKECASELETSQSSRAYDAMYTGEIISDKCKPNDSSTFPECRTLAKNFMDVENSASQHQIYAMGHCHIDLGWLWPFKETPKKIGRSWSIQRELMNFYPSHRFCSSSSKIFEIVKEQYNELYVDMKAKALAEEPTFFPVGGSYIEFDCNLPNGESMCRQFLLGQRFFAQEFGTRRELFFMPDTFGYTGALPQIMALSGIKYFVTTKLGWSIFNEFPHNTFYWKGIDGSTILAHYPPAHYSSTRGYVKEVLLSQTQFKDKGRSNSSMMFFGFGDGGGGPHDQMIERLDRMKDICGLPKVKIADCHEFYQDVEANAHDLMTWEGELYMEGHQGTYTSIAKVKKGNRLSEIYLRDAEIFATFNHISHQLLGTTAKDNWSTIHKLWEKLLLDQFHDVLPGASIGLIYDQTDKDYEEIQTETYRLGKENFAELIPAIFNVKTLTEGDVNAYAFINTTQYDRTNIFDIQGKQYRIYLTDLGIELIPKHLIVNTEENYLSIEEDLAESHYVVTNKFYIIQIGFNGQIESILDKRTKKFNLESTMKESIDKNNENYSKGNMFSMHEDLPIFWDAWDIWIYYMDTRKDFSASTHSHHLTEKVSLILKFTYNIPGSGKSTMIQDIVIGNSDERIDFKTTINWDEMHKCLRVYFPLNIKTDFATYDIQNGVIRRPTVANNTWEIAKYEVWAHKFADMSEGTYGVALLNDCKYGHSARDGVLSLTLLKAPKGPYEEADIHKHQFTYSILPHNGDFNSSNVLKEATNLNSELIEIPLILEEALEESKEITFIHVDQPNIIIDCFKLDEETHLSGIIRLHEHIGNETACQLNLNLSLLAATTKKCKISTITMCDIIEEEYVPHQETLLHNDETVIHLLFKPFQILTLKIAFLYEE